MIDPRKLLLFTIGILFGATLGVGAYVVMTGQQRLTETTEYLAQVQTLNEIIVGKEANITQLENGIFLHGFSLQREMLPVCYGPMSNWVGAVIGLGIPSKTHH